MNENKGPFGAIEKELEGSIKHWWVFLILGVLAMGIGIWLFFTPKEGFAALSIVFAIGFLISGLSGCAVAFINRKSIPAWGWNLAMGIIVTVLAIMMLVNMGMTVEVLVFYVAFSIMFNGFNSIGYSFALKSKGDKSWGWTLALGILVAIMSMVLMFHPVFAALTIVIWAGIAFVSLGISFCMIAYRLSKTKGAMKK